MDEVTLSSVGAFTLTSPHALSSSTVGSGGSLSQTCSSGIETDTITQASGSEIYTLTPTGSACVQPSQGSGVTVSVASGGGGGGSNYTPVNGAATTTATTSVVLSTTSTASMTVSQMQTLLASLETELQTLEAQGGSQIASTTASFSFIRNLQIGMTGSDVRQLQLFLISKNAGPAAEKLKAHGVTTFFGSLTKAALGVFVGVGLDT